MIRQAERPRRRLRAGPVVATVTTVAVVVGAIVAQGYDAQHTDRVESSVWVFRDAGQYARVNTSLGQIDTVRSVDDLKSVVQHGSDAAVVAQGGRLLWPVDPAAPTDLTESQDQAGSVGTPEGTETVVSAGSWVLYQTNGGAVWVGDLTKPQASATRLEPVQGDQADDEESAQYSATVATVDADGKVAVYSAGEGAVRVLDASTGALVSGPVSINSAPAKDADLAMAVVSGSWVLFDADAGRLWTAEHTKAVDVDLGALPKLQVSGGPGTKVYLADEAGLLEVGVRSGDVQRIVQAQGSAARPVVMADGLVVAAWLTSTGGTLWTSDRSDTQALAVSAADVGDQRQLNPVIVSNGDRAVLEETGTGLLWTVPDGKAIPLSQWSRIDQQTTTTGTQKVTEVTEEMPPVAVPDSFGVRTGSYVRLPVLLNDYDPNSGDVLTVDPASVSALDPGFGHLTLTSSDQMFVVQVQATSGSTTFSYQVTDGTMSSEPATVTLTVVPDATNVEPTWCVDQCSQVWPVPTLAPGGTARVPILDDWVDPDGDPIVLTSATVDDPTAPIHAVASADGTVTVHHTDPNGGPTSATVTVTVTDSHGAQAQRQLDVVVTSTPTLEVEPLALVTGQGVAATAVASDHVSSGSGSYRLVSADASAASADGLDVVASPDGTITAAPRRPGQFQATYTVHDEVTGAEASAVLRVICPDGAAALTMTPLTAFVRGHQDSTVDVLSAVNATTDNVLTLTQATSVPARGQDGYDAILTADVVDGSLLRLRGDTADGGPGLVGTVTVTVSDGASAAVTGQVSVFSVPEALGPPIAVPDAATVRVGAQVDIAVTANDVAPGDAALQIVTDSVIGSGASGEMVFASGSLVRYVAPDTPGTYQLRYSVAPVGYLEAQASTTVQVTVVPSGANRDPVPPLLVARVAAGQSVQIPVPTSDADPDGDPVVVVGVSQPAAGKGTATVADTGDSIVYQAAPTATTDQVTFTYRVRDSGGAEGTGRVRVAVTAADTNAGPVAYTDRVRLRQGDPVPAVLEPLINDRDPAGGQLSLHAVRPDAPIAEDDPERARLNGLVDTSQTDQGRVLVTAGDVLGTHAYIYTVKSSQTGSTAEGLLVVEVTAGSSVEAPQVRDTVLTAARRAELSRDGIDVISGKVVWPAGDPSSLSLEVWGPAASRYTVSGARIVGPLPERGELVPFTLRGTDRSGNEVVAHAFLRIPAFDDMRVSADPAAKAVQVDEGSSVKIALADRVTLAAGDRLEVADAASFSVQRSEASCVPSGQSVTYQAGNGAPWTDSCVVRVRLAGQTTWTDLVVPIQVAPKAPQPQLTSTSLTIAPGASETVDLKSLTAWEGGRVGDESKLVYVTSLVSDGFTLTQRGTTVTITATSGAVPGTRSSAVVTVAAYGGLRSSIDLVVGQAIPDTPRGATVNASCEASKGTCTVQLVGVPGEYDPFAGKPGSGLTLVQVGGSGGPSCSVATVTSTDAKSATVTWPSAPRPPGGSCQVPFTVRDAQERAGTGLLKLELPGYPGKPSATLATATENSVTFDVTLSTVTAYPPVTAVSVYRDGTKVADCATLYRCRVGDLAPNEPRSYTVRARNSVGESEDSSPVQAWAWKAPHITVAVDRVEAISTTESRVWLSVESGNDATAFWIRSQRYSRDSRTTLIPVVLPVGNHEIEVIPVGAVQPPPGVGGLPDGTTRVSVRAVGRPIVNVGAVSLSGTTARVEGASVDGNNSPLAARLTYAVSEDASVTCSDDGSPRGGRNRVDNSTGVFSGLSNNREYWFTVCGTNGYGVAGGSAGSTVVFNAGAPTVTRGYQLNTTATAQGGAYVYPLVSGNSALPQVSTSDGMTASFSFDGGATWPGTIDTFRSWSGWNSGTVPDVKVRQCGLGGRCSTEYATVSPVGPASPGKIRAAEVACDGTDPFTFDQPGVSGSATTSSTTAANGKITWTLAWRTGTPYAGLGSISVDSGNRCDAPEPPDPGP